MGLLRPVAVHGTANGAVRAKNGFVHTDDMCDLAMVVPGLTQGGDWVSLLAGELVMDIPHIPCLGSRCTGILHGVTR